MKKYKRIPAAVAIAFILSALIGCALFYKSGKNKRIIYSHRNEYHEVIQHLFDQEIVKNQPVGEIIQQYPPTKVSTHDNYLTLQYFTDNEEAADCCIYYSYYVHIIVRDNRLVKAFATEGLFSETSYTFFDVLNETSENDYWESRMKNAVVTSNL